MTSAVVLDQGGFKRIFQNLYLGASIGWITYPVNSLYPITAVGTYTLVPGFTMVTLNVGAQVTINLWNPLAANVAKPGLFVGLPLTVVDIGGHATAFPATINAPAGKTISGLSSVQVAVDFGAIGLLPDLDTGNWTVF